MRVTASLKAEVVTTCFLVFRLSQGSIASLIKFGG